MAIVIAIDAGTTGVRSLAIDPSGSIQGWSYREFTQHFPRPGLVEHDAAEIWEAVTTTLGELMATRRRARGRHRHHRPARDRRRVGPAHR